MTIGKRRTYLSTSQFEEEKRKWPRRPAKLLCNVAHATGFVRDWTVNKSLITDISEGGAALRTGPAIIPDEFYIVLGNNELVLGSTVVKRGEKQLHVRFHTELDTKIVDQLAGLETPFATLGKIFGEHGCLR